jgi:hypothetical protein
VPGSAAARIRLTDHSYNADLVTYFRALDYLTVPRDGVIEIVPLIIKQRSDRARILHDLAKWRQMIPT